MNIFRKIYLNLRMARRLGAFNRARKAGLSDEEARFYSDSLYPPTVDEIAYEEVLRNRLLNANENPQGRAGGKAAG